jgi:hypothetical protein
MRSHAGAWERDFICPPFKLHFDLCIMMSTSGWEPEQSIAWLYRHSQRLHWEHLFRNSLCQISYEVRDMIRDVARYHSFFRRYLWG